MSGFFSGEVCQFEITKSLVLGAYIKMPSKYLHLFEIKKYIDKRKQMTIPSKYENIAECGF